MNELRLPVRDGFARLPERVVFVTAAADGADDAAVGKDEHLGAHALWRRPGGGHDGDERCRLATIERVGDGGEDLLIHLQRLYVRAFAGQERDLLRTCAVRTRPAVPCQPERPRGTHGGSWESPASR